MNRCDLGGIAFSIAGSCERYGRRAGAVGLADVSEVIHVRVIDKKNVHAPDRGDPGVRGADSRASKHQAYSPSRCAEHSHSSWVLEEQCPVTGAELSCDSAQRGNLHVLSPGQGPSQANDTKNKQTDQASMFHDVFLLMFESHVLIVGLPWLFTKTMFRRGNCRGRRRRGLCLYHYMKRY